MNEQELNLIRKIAWSFYRTTFALDFDDLFSEACLAYLEGEKQFSPDSGTKKSTFLWTVMRNHLTDYTKKEINNNQGIANLTTGMDDEDTHNNLDYLPSSYKTTEAEVEERQEWERIQSMMSPEARAILYLILNDQSLYLQIDKPKICKGLIKQALREAGWKWQAIWDGFKELKGYAIIS